MGQVADSYLCEHGQCIQLSNHSVVHLKPCNVVCELCSNKTGRKGGGGGELVGTPRANP